MGATRSRQLVYVTHEYPARTQTFVEAEIRALREFKIPVKQFALHTMAKPENGEVLSPLSVLSGPTSILDCLRAAFGILGNFRAIVQQILVGSPGWKSIARQVYALMCAWSLVAQLGKSDASNAHFHAHFLGRCLDVATYVRLMCGPGTAISATAHAADASRPENVERLRSQLAHVRAVVCASESVAKELRRNVPRVHPLVVHCGVASHPPRDRRRFRSSKIYSVGRLVEKKGFDVAVEAARRLAADSIDFTWYFVGAGELEHSLKSSSADLVDSGHVVWLGAKKPEEVLELLDRDADIFVLPSRPASDGDIDGIPVALMEAMSLSIPVVSTRLSGIPELIQDEVTGLLTPPGDPDALHRAVAGLVCDPDRASVLGRMGAGVVSENFDIQQETKKLLENVFCAVEEGSH